MKAEDRPPTVSESMQGMIETVWFLQKARGEQLTTNKVFIDLTGEIVSGILLYRIVDWFLQPSGEHLDSLTKFKNKEWLVRTRAEWWKECRLTPRQFDRGIAVLEKMKIVETEIRKHRKSSGGLITHLTVDWKQLSLLLSNAPSKTEIRVRHRRKSAEKIPA